MIANVAFLAAITTFLAVAWLAGELSFLAPYKAGDLPASRADDPLAIVRALPEPLAPRTTASLAGSSCVTPAGSCRTWTGNWGPATPFCETSIGI